VKRSCMEFSRVFSSPVAKILFVHCAQKVEIFKKAATAKLRCSPDHGMATTENFYYVPYLTERTTPHYLLWGPHSDFSKCGSYFCRTLYLSVSCFLGWRWFCIVFFVFYAIRMFVFLNILVMVLVSLPMLVNVAHFCLCIVLGVVFLVCFGFLCMSIRGGYLLLCSIVFMS
jgi:hypothetical protein